MAPGSSLTGSRYSIDGLVGLLNSDAGISLREAMESAGCSPDYLAGRVGFEAEALRHLSLATDYGEAAGPTLSTKQMVVCPKGHEVWRAFSGRLSGAARTDGLEILDRLRSNHLSPEQLEELICRAAALYITAIDGESALQSEELQRARKGDIRSFVNHEEALRIVLGSSDSQNFSHEQVLPYTAINESKPTLEAHDVVVTVGGDNQFLGVFHKIQRLSRKLLPEIVFLPLNSDYEFSRGALTSAPAVFWPIIQRKLEAGSYREIKIPLLSVYSEVLDEDRGIQLKLMGHALTEVLIGAEERERITKCRVQKYSGEFITGQEYLFDDYQEGSGILIANSHGATGWFLDANGKNLDWVGDDNQHIYPHSCDFTPNMYMRHTECGRGIHDKTVISPGESLRIVNLGHGSTSVSLDSGPEGKDRPVRGGLALHVKMDGSYVRVIRFNDWLAEEFTRAFFIDNRALITRG